MTPQPKRLRRRTDTIPGSSARGTTVPPSKQKDILTPKFGAQLRRLRGRASRGEVCRMLATKGLPIDRSTLLQYERGTVRNPSVAILWTLSQHYGLKDVQFCDLVTLHTQELVGGESNAKAIESRDDLETRRLATIFRGFPPTLQKAVMTILLRMQAGDADVARLLMSSRERRVQ
jgi:transcriptional regulator with XRE-family HTH domain